MEKYNFDHILTYDAWMSLNDDTIDSAFTSYRTSRMCDFFAQEVQSAFNDWKHEKGFLYLFTDKQENEHFRKLSREDKRVYRTYQFILNKCLYDSDKYEDISNVSEISYKLLDLWEEKDRLYNQCVACHYYRLSSFLESMLEVRPLYKEYKRREMNRGKREEDLMSYRMFFFDYWK